MLVLTKDRSAVHPALAAKIVEPLWGENWGDLPAPQPTFAQERLYRKQRLAAAFRLFARHGFDSGGAGHITARDPEFPDHFWVNPAALHFSQINVSNLLLVNHSGEIVEGRGLLNKAAFAIHSELHKARPDLIAAAHSHSLYGKIWSTLGRLLDPISQDSAAFYRRHAIFRDFSGVVLDNSEGCRIAEALGGLDAVILQNHGLLTVAQSVECAVWRYLAMENACQVQLLAEASGQPIPMSHDVAEYTAQQTSSEYNGILAFQIYWEMLLKEESDFLD